MRFYEKLEQIKTLEVCFFETHMWFCLLLFRNIAFVSIANNMNLQYTLYRLHLHGYCLSFTHTHTHTHTHANEIGVSLFELKCRQTSIQSRIWHADARDHRRSVLCSISLIRSCKARVRERVTAADGCDRLQPVKCVSRLRPSEMETDDSTQELAKDPPRVCVCCYSVGLYD